MLRRIVSNSSAVVVLVLLAVLLVVVLILLIVLLVLLVLVVVLIVLLVLHKNVPPFVALGTVPSMSGYHWKYAKKFVKNCEKQD